MPTRVVVFFARPVVSVVGSCFIVEETISSGALWPQAGQRWVGASSLAFLKLTISELDWIKTWELLEKPDRERVSWELSGLMPGGTS